MPKALRQFEVSLIHIPAISKIRVAISSWKSYLVPRRFSPTRLCLALLFSELSQQGNIVPHTRSMVNGPALIIVGRDNSVAFNLLTRSSIPKSGIHLCVSIPTFSLPFWFSNRFLALGL